jgi:hypothetical protein
VKRKLEALCRGENSVNLIKSERTVIKIAGVDGISSILTNGTHIVRATGTFSGFIVGLIGRDFVYRFSGCRCKRRFCESGRWWCRACRWRRYLESVLNVNTRRARTPKCCPNASSDSTRRECVFGEFLVRH